MKANTRFRPQASLFSLALSCLALSSACSNPDLDGQGKTGDSKNPKGEMAQGAAGQTASEDSVDNATVSEGQSVEDLGKDGADAKQPQGGETIVAGDVAGMQEQESQLPSVNDFKLPIEVFGTEGTQEKVAFLLDDAQAKLATHLWLQVHNVRYDDKASVQLNGGAWIPLKNTTAEVLGMGKTMGGIGGAFSALKLKLPVPANALVAGTNILAFRFNKSNGLSMGYRVLSFNLQDDEGKMLIPQKDLPKSNPAEWEPASVSVSDIAEGKNLWEKGRLKSSYLPGATDIKANCASCHTSTGFDLKYFGYSDKSIIERAKFHGLSADQGKKIAIYIRNIPVKAVGRPWNPPYQPGPGLTSKPVSEWAAGAGLENVPEDDWEAVKSMFPNGVKRDALMEGDTNRFQRYTAQDTPTAFQLPDWNHWLPEIHPIDAFGEAWVANANGFQKYASLRNSLIGKSDADRKRFYFQVDGHKIGELWGLDSQLPSDVSNARNASVANSTKVYSEKLWRLVKHFELHEEFNMIGYAPDKFGSFGLARSWPNARRTVFDSSPFLSGLDSPNTGSKTGSNPINYEYLGNAWYHMQLLLNAGQRNGFGHEVIPWEYASGFVSHMNQITGYKLPGFSLIWARKGLDEGDNGHIPKDLVGWNFRRVNLQYLNLFNYEGGKRLHPFWIQNQTPEIKKVLDLFVQVTAEKDASWLPEQYPRSANMTDPISHDGSYWDSPKFRLDSTMTYDYEVRSTAVHRFSFLQNASLKKVFHPALINGQANFAAAIWPGLDNAGVARNPWNSLIVASGTAPSAPAISLGTPVSYSVGGTRNATKKTVRVKWTAVPGVKSYNVKRSDTPNGPFMTVAYFRTSGEFVDEIPVSGRTYYYKMSANSDTSESLDSSSAAINIAP